MKKSLLLLLASALFLTGCNQTGPQGPKGDPGDQGIQGEPGVDGASFLNGSSDPTNLIGKDGDCYLNTNSNDIFHKTNGEWSKIGNIKGVEGKSAYQTYIEYHPDYKKSEEEWINEFCKKDETDYSLYANFEFTPVTYGGVKGYNASYIGAGGDVVVPETFNMEPVLGFKFGFNDIHEILEEYPDYKINSIYVPSSVKLFALNGNSEYALHCLVETAFIFTASLNEVIYSNFIFEEICFDGSLEELLNTNLIEKFPISNIGAKDEHGEYQKVIDNFDKYVAKYASIREQIELLRDECVPDMTTKFNDGFIDVPTKVEYEFEGSTLEASVKVVVNDETAACSAYQNRLTYSSTNIDHFKGKEVFLVDFVFELEGKKHIGASSMFIVSKMPNIFKTFDISFDLTEYEEVEEQNVGNAYSKVLTVNFKKENKLIKAYNESGFGVFETAMPDLKRDENNPADFNINYDKENKYFTCVEAGEYSLGFGYLKSKDTFVYYAIKLDILLNKSCQTIYEIMQNNYRCHGNNIYVKVGDTVTFPNTIDVKFDGVLYTFNLSMRQVTDHKNIITDGNVVTFKLENDKPAFASLDYYLTIEEPYHLIASFIAFNISK